MKVVTFFLICRPHNLPERSLPSVVVHIFFHEIKDLGVRFEWQCIFESHLVGHETIRDEIDPVHDPLLVF